MVLISLLLLIMPAGASSGENGIDYDSYRNSWDLLKENKDDWVCVDHAVNYSRHNPGWGMVILSPSPRFSVQPHMTNYMIDDNRLLIHEAQVDITYEIPIVDGPMTVPYYKDFPGIFSRQWEGETYFHFIPDEAGVIRVYTILKDNRNEFFDYTYEAQENLTNGIAGYEDRTAFVLSENLSGNTTGITAMPDDITDNISDNRTDDSTADDRPGKNEEPAGYAAKFIRAIRSLIGTFK
ncbi:hypothetical protein [Methanolobus chelungpuianus]|uniref:Uncharacterized protein n=1 Tax=Methanolobus chelungpuianus TaxID=502115 RepID=A0AAE3HDM2_9EURY|nr:hypothetical protein [Methanolobus chelungpuianus]MCQ6963538.1 hypothetical protein [Methanolobus chelungpuianus]